ncbi:MAG TPA: hypothetical protein VGH46_03875, partial [Gaiellaceae bacterium]
MRDRLDLQALGGVVCGAALFGIARLLPETGFGLWLRLAAATFVLLLPGWLVARCLGQRRLAATLSWSVALVGGGLALAFTLGSSLELTIGFALAVGLAALVVLVAGPVVRADVLPPRVSLVRLAVGAAGLILGGALWAIHDVLAGDAFMHLGRIR